ncbi:MAG: TonB-dependent receptor [Bacteroidota bacterium]
MKNLHNKSNWCLLLLLSFSIAWVSAQERQITGKVSDELGGPLPGVSILLEGTGQGATSDFDGNYQITVPGANSVLVFSYLGFATQTISVGNRATIDVVLSEEVNQLDEFIVVGYGSQRKSDVTGAISKVDGEDFENIPVASSDLALQGRAAGVQIVRNGGAPGAEANIRIRGTGTLNNSEPLIVIDGFPGGTLETVNPNDIESIEVLKDASASAIYGTRAANGVVIVTTKQGKVNERLSFSVNAYTGFSTAIKTLDVLDAPTLAEIKRERYTNDGVDIDAFWLDPEREIQRTDWQDELLETGIVQNVDLGIRGGGEKSNYSFSMGYYDEKGLIKNSFFNRASARLNSTHRPKEWLTIGQNLQLTSSKDNALNTSSAQSGILWSALRFHPSIPVFNEDGSYGSSQENGQLGDINNPIFTADTEDDITTRHNLLGSVFAEVEVIEGLKLKANFGLDLTVFDRDIFNIRITDQTRNRNNNELTRQYFEQYSIVNEFTAAYKKLFAEKHNLEVIGGYSYQVTKRDGFSVRVEDFGSEAFDQRVIDAGTSVNIGNVNSDVFDEGLESVFGRLNYQYDNRYLFTFTYRADGSSRFADGNRWGYFPAFSAGWNVSNEAFWNVDSISSLKLTGGWGQLGNQNVRLNQFLGVFEGGDRVSFGDQQNLGTSQIQIPNPDISWETSEITDIGIEAGLLNNQLVIDLGYFIKDTKDMLLPPASLLAQGTARVTDQNVGELRNSGFELEINYRGSIGEDVTYSIGGNASFIKNEVTSLNSPFLESRPFYGRQNVELARIVEGEPLASFFGWEADGLYQNTSEINNDPGLANDPRREQGLIQPGDVRFRDLDGNGLIDGDDRTFIGNPHPGVVYGINGSLKYKNFDLNVLFLGEAGRQIYNADRIAGLDTDAPFNLYAETVNRWTGEGTSNSTPRVSINDSNGNYRSSTLFVEDAGFFRLKNLTVGYSLPDGITDKAGLSKVRLYATGQNIFTITNYSGMDPELGVVSNAGSTNQFANGQFNVDYAQFPQARTWTLGVMIDF